MQNTSFFMGRDGFMWFIGVVEDRNDPERLGRVRVRALGYHTEDKTKIPTESLPWASVMMPVTSPSMSGLGETPFLYKAVGLLDFSKMLNIYKNRLSWELFLVNLMLMQTHL